MSQEILDAHNRYRAEVGVPPLQWSEDLANQAIAWASHLASTGSFEHSSTEGQGENLWKGTAKAFSFTHMVDSWGKEKQYFARGVFPNVSTTGNWADVGHYTQVVWKDTSRVGCGWVDAPDGNCYLVCRYVSPGNFTGQAPF
jgi:Cysteine-rich secretory protein family